MLYIVLILSGEYTEYLTHLLIFHSSQFPVTFLKKKKKDEVKGKDSPVGLETIQDQINSMERKKSC